jgi:carbon storage regulator
VGGPTFLTLIEYETEVTMLVLSRRENEQVLFPELGITIKVIKTKGSQVRLGISAPKSIKVLRGELAFEEPQANPNLESIQKLLELPRAFAS